MKVSQSSKHPLCFNDREIEGVGWASLWGMQVGSVVVLTRSLLHIPPLLKAFGRSVFSGITKARRHKEKRMV